jgi:D-glycerate 3-kinase
MNVDELLLRERLPETYRQTIELVHAPLIERISAAIKERAGTLVVGICGAQGSGKSTLALILKTMLEAQHVRVVVLSLDDLYLTRQERSNLAQRVHPLLATRGVPGTHDVGLGLRTLSALEHSRSVALPSFDKSVDERHAEDLWPRFDGPAQVVLFEGWCVGALAQSGMVLREPINSLEKDSDPSGTWRYYVNEQLAGPYQALFGRIDRLVLLRAPSFDVVFDWRLEQERKLAARVMTVPSPHRLMDENQIAKFIQHYERITRHILDEMPGRADIVISLGADRRVLDVSNRESMQS